LDVDADAGAGADVAVNADSIDAISMDVLTHAHFLRGDHTKRNENKRWKSIDFKNDIITLDLAVSI
tara:strand:+ start:68 stop:265 length:198 start_codon:yes stop_codon:yes gene_type:complete